MAVSTTAYFWEITGNPRPSFERVDSDNAAIDSGDAIATTRVQDESQHIACNAQGDAGIVGLFGGLAFSTL
jgi:hypothetical protein